MKNKSYIAHSELIDTEKNINIPPQPYEKHVDGVYNNCGTSIDRIEPFIDPNWFPVLKKTVLLASIYHDLGKLDTQAQSVLYKRIKTKMINHVDAGVAYLLTHYTKTNDVCFLIAAYLILAHHIGLPNYDKVIKTERKMLSAMHSANKSFRDRKSMAKYKMGRKMVKTHVDKNLKRYLKIHHKFSKLSLSDVAAIKTSRGQTNIFLANPLALKLAIGILVDADHEDTSVNYGDTYPIRMKHIDAQYYLNNLLKKVEKMQEDYNNGIIHCSEERFKLRQEFFKVCGEINIDENFYLVDGTVGIGKTLSIMYAALTLALKCKMDTLIFVMPYIALIDQSASQYIQYLFNDPKDSEYNLNVIHSIFNSKNTFMRRYNKGFNAPINITTSVNFFSIVSSNHTCVFKNLHKFVGAVIAIDEYQAFADYIHWPTMLRIMSDMAKYFSCKFIFSSGTPIRYWEMDEITRITEEMISVCHAIPTELYDRMISLETKRVKIIDCKKTWGFKRLSKEVLKLKHSVFVILGTRRKAVSFTARLIRENKNKDKHIHLRFSGMSPQDRIRQYDKIKEDVKNDRPVIVVATQGSDIGLDLSFHYGFKESSSYDSVAQMKGRINRGCEFTDSFLLIFKLSKCPNGNGEEFKSNPAFNNKTEIFESEKKLHELMSPEYSTYIAEREIAAMSKDSKNEMNDLARMWKNKKFEDFSDKFSLINTPMIHLLVNLDVFEKMKRGEYIPYSILQNNIVNMFYDAKKIDELKNKGLLIAIEDELPKLDEDEEDENKYTNNTFGLYYWKGDYDPDNFGIFQDSYFGLVETKTLIV